MGIDGKLTILGTRIPTLDSGTTAVDFTAVRAGFAEGLVSSCLRGIAERATSPGGVQEDERGPGEQHRSSSRLIHHNPVVVEEKATREENDNKLSNYSKSTPTHPSHLPPVCPHPLRANSTQSEKNGVSKNVESTLSESFKQEHSSTVKRAHDDLAEPIEREPSIVSSQSTVAVCGASSNGVGACGGVGD